MLTTWPFAPPPAKTEFVLPPNRVATRAKWSCAMGQMELRLRRNGVAPWPSATFATRGSNFCIPTKSMPKTKSCRRHPRGARALLVAGLAKVDKTQTKTQNRAAPLLHHPPAEPSMHHGALKSCKCTRGLCTCSKSIVFCVP